MTSSRATLTLEGFLDLPDTEPASEFVCVEVFQKPIADNAHSAIQVFLSAALLGFLTRTRLGWVRTEFRCVFGPERARRSWVPDIVFVRRDAMPRGDARAHRFLEIAPDIAIEILSRGRTLGCLPTNWPFTLPTAYAWCG